MELPETTREISADWLTGVLRENGYLKGAGVDSLEVEPVGAGEGFSSDMARLRVTYSGNNPGLPATMIAKLPTAYAGISKLTHIANFYEREIRFYREVAHLSPVRTPGLIYGGIDSELGRYVLILEDCDHYTLADPEMQGLDYGKTSLITRKIADFHSRWWDAPDLMSFPWMPKIHIDTGGRLFRKCWDAGKEMKDFTAALPPGGREEGNRIYEYYPWILESAPKDKLTIQHNDLRADNIFFDPDSPDDPVVFFDWAMADVERGVGDLSFLLGTSLTPTVRREVELVILREYHQQLVKNGIAGYSFDECWHDYLMGLLFKTYVGVIAFARCDLGDSRSVRIWSLILNRMFSAITDNEATALLPLTGYYG